ncbi:hypothetical protein TH66_11825 [Carbonactinospora thermoautotrophica]|uniref:Uncharacterized protein n=1 Tax=Carbonactinospora thermoautotrophica TaxID=1469144 RepID=A0A132N0P3_9ACTN|nr:hypothetical protein TH66_11825 [Carbonactinospora thermoautotrophica]KWX06855.1 hypothetical protein TR74_20675 [Carbonactinospora thermoautotrophica]
MWDHGRRGAQAAAVGLLDGGVDPGLEQFSRSWKDSATRLWNGPARNVRRYRSGPWSSIRMSSMG